MVCNNSRIHWAAMVHRLDRQFIAIAVAFCIQAMALRKKDLVPAELVENVRQLLAHGKLKDADQACRERPCPLSFVLVSGISEIEYGWPAVEKALEDSTAEQAARGGFLTFRLCRGL